MPLDIVQSAAFMAFAAAGVSDHIGTTDELNEAFETFLEGQDAQTGDGYVGFFPRFNDDPTYGLIGGDWSVAWGPVAALAPGKHEPGAAANCMYVAHSPSQRTYVVAVAATAQHSLYDWLVEDFDVTWLDTVRWSTWVEGSGDARISGGTNRGLANLHRMHLKHEDTLTDFLRGVDAAGQTLIVAGHSLGGALSPALALLLSAELKERRWSAIRVMPLAGPTPGNDAFAALFVGTFLPVPEPTRPGFSWNCDHQNIHDLVPRAWDNLQSALPRDEATTNGRGQRVHPSIWGYVTWEVALYLQAIIDVLKALPLGVTYRTLNPAVFEAPWGCFEPKYSPNWCAWPDHTPDNPITSPVDLNRLITASHYDQYTRYFGLIPIPPLPKTDQQMEADRMVQLKHDARLAVARLSTGGAHPPSPGAA